MARTCNQFESKERYDLLGLLEDCDGRKNAVGQQVFQNLSQVVKVLFSLPFSNAAVERVFSQLKLMKMTTERQSSRRVFLSYYLPRWQWWSLILLGNLHLACGSTDHSHKWEIAFSYDYGATHWPVVPHGQCTRNNDELEKKSNLLQSVSFTIVTGKGQRDIMVSLKAHLHLMFIFHVFM